MRNKIKTLLLLTAFLFSGFMPSAELAGQEYGDVAETIKMVVGEIKIIPTRLPNRVMISKPDIADIEEVTNTEMTLVAKSVGTSNLHFWDVFGEQSIEVKVVTEDMAEVKRRIDSLLLNLGLPDVYTQAEDEEGKVFLLGSVKRTKDKADITRMLGKLKGKTVDLINVMAEDAVIEIDVQVLELTTGASKSLGISWPGNVNLTEVGSPGLTQVGPVKNIMSTGSAGSTQEFTTETPGTPWGSLFRVLNVTRDSFSIRLDALITEGKARILSRPRLSCQSGKEASLLVGGEKPNLSTDVVVGGGSDTNIEYKEYGIQLKVSPTVTDEGRIRLAVNMQVSDVQEAVVIGSAASPTAKAFPIIKRNASTELILDNNQTLSIGGLIKQKSEETLRKVPWFGDIPILGAAFRQRTSTRGGGFGEKNDTELFIILTPKIVSPSTSGRKLSRPALRPLAATGAQTVPSVSSSINDALMAAERIGPSRQEGALFSAYTGIIQRRILERTVYPYLARQAGYEGTAILSLNLDYRGNLLSAKILRTSGYQVLDDDAAATAKSILSYPPFPPGIESESLWVEVPVSYRLN